MRQKLITIGIRPDDEGDDEDDDEEDDEDETNWYKRSSLAKSRINMVMRESSFETEELREGGEKRKEKTSKNQFENRTGKLPYFQVEFFLGLGHSVIL